MAYERKIYKEAEHILKRVGNFGVYEVPEKRSRDQHKAIQMLITYNILVKNGTQLKTGSAFQEVQEAGVKRFLQRFDGDFSPSPLEMLWNLLTKNPIVIGIIIVLLSAWLTMRFMK